MFGGSRHRQSEDIVRRICLFTEKWPVATDNTANLVVMSSPILLGSCAAWGHRPKHCLPRTSRRETGGVKPEDAAARLRALRDEAATLPPSTSSAEFNSWQPRVRSVLTRALGESHHITQEFVSMSWTPTMFVMGDNSAFTATFRATVLQLKGFSTRPLLNWSC